MPGRDLSTVNMALMHGIASVKTTVCYNTAPNVYLGVLRWQPHRRSGLANLPSVGAVP